ncbi:hypothetical protein BASA81_002697 [Batrachochytrium salamandrivorans]|nr:hypothetical protein BASA81_002697 [Batrachochytrium salamandrivorans]
MERIRFVELLCADKQEEEAGVSVTCVALPVSDSDSPSFFCCGRSSGSISVYDIASNSSTYAERFCRIFPSAVNDLCLATNSLLLAAVFEDGLIKIFRLSLLDDGPGMREVFSALPSKKNAATSCCFSPQTHLLVVGTGVGSVLVYDVRNQQLVRKLCPSSQAQSPVSQVAFHPDGSVFLTTATDGLARVWDSTGPCLATLIGSSDRGLGSGVFSPNGRFALLGALEGEGLLGLWDLAHSGRLKRVRRYPRRNSKYWMRAGFDAKGNVVYGNELGQLRCLDSATGRERGSVQLDGISVPVALATFQSHVVCGGLGSSRPKLFLLVE